ncbi:hypothetical protein [Ulvibacterium sp.]|uniref:hypothetical protein n=1 Tax=Ulvibacterium sp. TaxID=2665914 RepID=UPI00260D1A64|nr:hypothetical protein [Ulvibacterium sp.]
MILAFQEMEIDENILSRSFSEYHNVTFIKIDQNTSYDYGISYHYNYFYPTESPIPFSFMGHTVSRAAFAVKEEQNSIQSVVLFLEVFDIDLFYSEMVEKFGQPGTVSVSKIYLEQHGYKIPTEIENFNESYYDSLPVPKLKDYKNLRNINWYEVNDVKNDMANDTNIIVRNNLVNRVMDTETHEVEITFLESKKDW